MVGGEEKETDAKQVRPKLIRQSPHIHCAGLYPNWLACSKKVLSSLLMALGILPTWCIFPLFLMHILKCVWNSILVCTWYVGSVTGIELLGASPSKPSTRSGVLGPVL